MIPRRSPRDRETYYEYAIAVGDSAQVLNRKRYDTFDDAYFDSCIKRNEDRIKYGKVMVKRQVVRRKVVIGEWSVCDPSKFRISR